MRVRAARFRAGVSLRSGRSTRHMEARADGFAIFDWARRSAVGAGIILWRSARDFES